VREIGDLEVATVLNGEIRKNTVSNMIFPPWSLVSFHSKVMTPRRFIQDSSAIGINL
jgi:hypothetical protein